MYFCFFFREILILQTCNLTWQLGGSLEGSLKGKVINQSRQQKADFKDSADVCEENNV